MAVKIYRELNNGDRMPGLGLGTWQADNEDDFEKALIAALEIGYRHIDAAYVYENEHVIGRVLKEWLSSGKLKRDDIFITTKLPMCAINPSRVEMFIKKSLENLQLDYLDLYLVHFPVGTNYIDGLAITPPDKLELEDTNHLEVWKKMEEQVEAGRTKAIGLSNFNKRQVERVFNESSIKPACLQVELHLAMQQKELVSFCQELGIVVVAYSPLGSPGINKFLEKCGQDTKPLPDMMHHPTVARIAEKYKKSNGQIMLRFLIQKDVVPIPKSTNPKRLQENIDVFDFDLDDDDMRDLEELDQGESARICDFKFFPRLDEHPEWPF